MFKKVILSPLGEVTQDTRSTGDTIRYRIYYWQAPRRRSPREGSSEPVPTNEGVPSSTEATPRRMVITDRLDSGLSHVVVFNDGQYDPATHAITWTVKELQPQLGRLPRKDAFVEFEAVVGSTKLIRNRAYLKVGNQRAVPSNTVETIVAVAPKLGWIPLAKGAQRGEAM